MRKRILKTTFRKLVLALAASAAMGSAQAGVLTWQDVVFTTSWTDNMLTLEIDAAARSGNWSGAALLGALSLKDIGRFDSVSVSAAPKGAEGWQLSARELNAKGCAGGGAKRGDSALCLSGAPIALRDDMVFRFAFTGTPQLDEPHLKVQFLDGANRKTGDLLSQTITASKVVIPPPETPVTPPVTPPVKPPVVVPPVVELPDSNQVPEPQTAVMLLAGLALMGVALRKRA